MKLPRCLLGLALLFAAQAATAAELTITCGSSGAGVEVCRTLIKEWSAKTGHQVRLYIGPESSTDQLALYRKQFAEKSNDIDVLMVDMVWPGMLEDHLLDLTPFAGAAPAQHTREVIRNLTLDGKLLAMPWFADIPMLFYRKDLLQKYRLAVPTTWAALAAAAKRIQDGERKAGNYALHGYLFQANGFEGLTCNVIEWIASHGGGAIIDANGNITVDNPGAARALDTAASWIGAISPPEVRDFTDEDTRKEFIEGHAAFMRNWSYVWHLAQRGDSPVRGRIAVAPLPHGEGGAAAMTLGGWNLAVSKYSRQPRVAAELVMFLTSRAVQKRRVAMVGALPTYPDLYDDPEIRAAAPYLKTLGDVFGKAVIRPSTITGERYGEVSRAIWSAATTTLDGGADGRTAVRQLQRDLVRIRKGPAW